jgi:hypothetical protein
MRINEELKKVGLIFPPSVPLYDARCDTFGRFSDLTTLLI